MNKDNMHSRINTMHDEPLEVAEYRVRHLLDAEIRNKPIILHGAGNIGRRVAKILCADGLTPLCFTDTNENTWGSKLCGIPIFSPYEAVKKFGAGCLFIATVFNREHYSDFKVIYKYFQEEYSVRIYPYTYLAWRYPEEPLPHFAQSTPYDIIPHKDTIVNIYNSFTDERSRKLFQEFVAVSMTADYANFSEHDDEIQYFPPEITAALPDSVTFVDCGSYDGDTLRDFLTIIGSEKLFAYHAFEPDRENFHALKMFIATLPMELQHKIFCYNYAVGDKNGNIQIESTGTEGSNAIINEAAAYFGGGGDNVQCVALDTIFYNEKINMIKLDIEGYEVQALRGAENLLKRDDPVLAVAAYHKPQDFFYNTRYA